MRTSIVLTVAQSKRLIARAVVKLPEVRQALDFGTIAIGRGTTDAYVVEELLGETIPKGEYVAGRTLPPGVPGERLGTSGYPDVVIKMGQRIPNLSVLDALPQMGPGDVFIKGGNALNYPQGVVGVLIGHPTGGTVGGMYGTVVSQKIHLIIPIGLEKLVYEDIAALSRDSRQSDIHAKYPVPSLLPITGIVVTEIEALQVLCGVHARLLAAGGVGGAEGAVWLMLEGEQSALDAALELHASLQQEPNLALKLE
jgi:hypothetical protein